jgi:hypothetical protein
VPNPGPVPSEESYAGCLGEIREGCSPRHAATHISGPRSSSRTRYIGCAPSSSGHLDFIVSNLAEMVGCMNDLGLPSTGALQIREYGRMADMPIPSI